MRQAWIRMTFTVAPVAAGCQAQPENDAEPNKVMPVVADASTGPAPTAGPSRDGGPDGPVPQADASTMR